MTAAGNKYELAEVTDLVRGSLLNGSVNRVPRAVARLHFIRCLHL